MKLVIFCFSILLVTKSFAGDKIGNGGGLWACGSQDQIQTATLVDFYEAVQQFDLNLPVPQDTSAFNIVDSVNLNLQSKLPDYATKWSQILADVKTKIRYVNSELVVVNDALYILRPLGSLCRTGWNYVQFANYTNYNEVLIRQDLWNSTVISAVDKAGLIWHEVIYRWMREEFGDTDSVRARHIVGLIFSDLDSVKLRNSLQQVLAPSVSPKPDQPVWICLTMNSMNYKYFFEYGTNELMTKSQVIQSCQIGSPDFPNQCDDFQSRCGSFTESAQKYTCSVKNLLDNKNYAETGRSLFEAEAKARKACSDVSNRAVHCDTNITCQ